MQITYQAKAMTLVEYANNEPDSESIPTIRGNDELGYYLKDGWVVIGNATVTVDYLEPTDIAAQQMDALKAKLQSVRAENQQRENAILDQISKLQAISYEAA